MTCGKKEMPIKKSISGAQFAATIAETPEPDIDLTPESCQLAQDLISLQQAHDLVKQRFQEVEQFKALEREAWIHYVRLCVDYEKQYGKHWEDDIDYLWNNDEQIEVIEIIYID